MSGSDLRVYQAEVALKVGLVGSCCGVKMMEQLVLLTCYDNILYLVPDFLFRHSGRYLLMYSVWAPVARFSLLW